MMTSSGCTTGSDALVIRLLDLFFIDSISGDLSGGATVVVVGEPRKVDILYETGV